MSESSDPVGAPSEVVTAEGLRYTDYGGGDGASAGPGDRVSVHYVGSLEDGRVFDSSVERGQPFQFELGRGAVIRGWEIGITGMRAGDRRRLVIPSDLAYGARGAGGVIPPNATLVFEVHLLAIN
jgi:FKBP-type peptidyl-prolyl cis-trans isomerase